jgi:polyhydroxybutyrate depolymerase
VGGLKRTYLVHVPNLYDGSQPYPTVLGFHGGGSGAKQLVFSSGLNETTDRENFIAVYPNGTGETIQGYGVFRWNGGSRQPGGTDPNLAKINDVEFTRAVLNDLATVARIDEKRIYATGFSNGGIMTYRLASELSDRIAAIAPIAASMGIEKLNPQRPVSVIHFHGAKDGAAPFKGGKGTTGGIPVLRPHPKSLSCSGLPCTHKSRLASLQAFSPPKSSNSGGL